MRHQQRLGGCPKVDKEQALSSAVALAAESDVAIVVVGLNSDWEAEGFDRPNLSLPCDQDTLISRVAQANSRSVVVIQAVSFCIQCTVYSWLISYKQGISHFHAVG